MVHIRDAIGQDGACVGSLAAAPARMHSLPPPNSVPPPPPPPPPPTTPSLPPRAPVRLIAGVAVATLVSVGVGVFLLNRDDEAATNDATATSTSTGDSVLGGATSSTVLIEGPPAGGTVVVPDGALDLGDGVYLPIDAALDVTGDDPFTLTNNTSASTMIVQVARREPGEDPNVLLQEYIDIFDGDYTLVSYLPSETQQPGVAGFDNLRYSRVAYMLYQPELEYPNVVGEVGMWMRNDGLTILADTYGSAASPISDGAFDAMLESLVAAPSLGAPAEWFPAKATMPDTVHQGADLPFNRTRRLLLPDGFQVTARSDFTITASNDNDTVSVSASLAVADRAAARALATELLADYYGATDVGSLIPTGSGALTFDTTSWTGTDIDGTAVTGEVWLQFDDVSQTVVVVTVAHRTDEWDANEMVMMVASVAGSGPASAGNAGGT